MLDRMVEKAGEYNNNSKKIIIISKIEANILLILTVDFWWFRAGEFCRQGLIITLDITITKQSIVYNKF